MAFIATLAMFISKPTEGGFFAMLVVMFAQMIIWPND